MRSTLRCDVCGRAIEGTALGETGSFGMKVWHPGCKPATPTQQQAAEGALTDEQMRVLAFLYGTGNLDGAGFGSKPEGVTAPYWWRKHLRRAFPQVLDFITAQGGSADAPGSLYDLSDKGFVDINKGDSDER